MPDAATGRSEPHTPGGRSGGRRGVARDAGLRVGEVRDLPRRRELAFALADHQSQHLVATAVTAAAVGRMQRLNGREAVWLHQELLHDGLTGLHAVPQPDRACPAAAGAPSPIGGGTTALLLDMDRVTTIIDSLGHMLPACSPTSPTGSPTPPRKA